MCGNINLKSIKLKGLSVGLVSTQRGCHQYIRRYPKGTPKGLLSTRKKDLLSTLGIPLAYWSGDVDYTEGNL